MLVMGPTERGPRPKLRVEILARRAEDAQAFLAEISEHAATQRVPRACHLAFFRRFPASAEGRTAMAFHELPRVNREDVILPEGLLGRIERHTVQFAERADELLAAGRSLKRGVLLYGAPGVGKA